MEATDRQATCEERIASELTGRREWLRDLLTVGPQGSEDEEAIARLAEAGEVQVPDNPEEMDFEDVREQAMQRIYESPLAVSSHKVYRIELSYGGPQDYLEVHADDEGDITRITYHFLDWFDGAVRTLEGDDFDVMADYARSLIPDLD